MKIFILFILPIFLSCNVKEEELTTYMWKYSDGLYLGDVINFTKYRLKNDTIYENGNAKYVVKTSIGYFGYPTKMKIKDIKTKEEGRYIGK